MRAISPVPAMSVRVAEEIRTVILSGALAPGARVRQEEMAARLGVSREPVRHALRVLEREGLIRTLPRRGTIVAPVDPDLILDIYEFREAIEAVVAHKLARMSSFDAAELTRVVADGRGRCSWRAPAMAVERHDHLSSGRG